VTKVSGSLDGLHTTRSNRPSGQSGRVDHYIEIRTHDFGRYKIFIAGRFFGYLNTVRRVIDVYRPADAPRVRIDREILKVADWDVVKIHYGKSRKKRLVILSRRDVGGTG
jgi:hypothetical protein